MKVESIQKVAQFVILGMADIQLFFNFFWQLFDNTYIPMSETIIDYFRRFDNSVTQSLYSCLTIEDYYKNKALFQYLDYDRENIFRKSKIYCGIRNIDNSCYLSSTLQILYNIQWLRERIFRVPEQEASEFLRELQKLFALMYKGTLTYVDPTELFNVLKKMYPDLFVSGSQNDFHQVFTLILDQLQKSLINEDDKKFFKKLFCGRMKVQLSDEKGKISSLAANDSGNSFNMINLMSCNKTFENALWNFKNQIIEGYKTESGDKVKASKQINFIETPAILSFFINRVTFVDNKPSKDSSEFDFQENIMFAKTSSSKINKESDVQIQHNIKQLNAWIAEIKQKKQFLMKTIEYLEESDSQFVSINTPNIQNPLGAQSKKTTKKYIQTEIEVIDKQILKTETEISTLEKKRIKEAEDNYTQLYNLWAVMIHCGTTADSGHYKICIKVDPQKNVWAELNDRRTEEITYEKILQYKRKGQICCIFYKRSTLVSQPEKAQIPSSLKKFVQQEEQRIFKKIDNARILQGLYQQYESANIIWQFQNISLRQQQKLSTYFFKPLLHLIVNNSSPQTCKGFILYEIINQPKFMETIRNKSIDQGRQIKIPKIQFGIPEQYWQISEALKQFLCLEFSAPIEAYNFISIYMNIKIKNSTTLNFFNMLREVILLKGIFYQSLFVQLNLLTHYEDISKIVDRICKCIGQQDSFVVKVQGVRSAIHEKFINKIVDAAEGYESVGVMKKQMSISPSVVTSTFFSKRFGFWIEQRKWKQFDQEAVLKEYKKFYSSYGETFK